MAAGVRGVRVVGAGADTVIAIHGGPGVDLESIAGDFAPLAAQHTVIFYDQRGGGKSQIVADPAQLTLDRHLADLEAVRAHFGIRKMTLVGHSWGGLLAVLYALETGLPSSDTR